MSRDITIEGVNWNIDYYQSAIAEGLTEQQFIQQQIWNRMYSQFAPFDQTKILEQVYQHIKNA